MTLPNEPPLNKLQFYVTTGYACGYLPNHMAQSLIASPQHLVNSQVYSQLIQQGFRRSGQYVYRPHCEHCNACIPVRILVNEVSYSRNQKRIFKQYDGLQIQVLPTTFNAEHFALYQHYQKARHTNPVNPDDTVVVDNEESYRSFLCATNVETVIVEFRQNDLLKMVSIVDILQNGISAVYTFFDTLNKRDSLGTYNILWQIDWTRQLGLDYLYLGYWIEDCQKMAYKNRFQPQEHWRNGMWQQAKIHNKD